MRKIQDMLEPGKSYHVSARVRYDDYEDALGKKIIVDENRVIRITVKVVGSFFLSLMGW